MPTYTYECECCSEQQDHWLSIASQPETMECRCGGQARKIINWRGDSTVKGNQKDFKLSATDVPIGWERGNTDPVKQEARYRKIIESERSRAVANDKAAIKNGLRKIASVPRELMRTRSNQFGKDYLDPSSQSTTEIKQKLKEDGLLFKD